MSDKAPALRNSRALIPQNWAMRLHISIKPMHTHTKKKNTLPKVVYGAAKNGPVFVTAQRPMPRVFWIKKGIKQKHTTERMAERKKKNKENRSCRWSVPGRANTVQQFQTIRVNSGREKFVACVLSSTAGILFFLPFER